MLPQYTILAILFATSIFAIPLNINLGAYSPALVVGDGEISFDSTQKASELMATLATGAVTAGQQENTGQQGETPAGEKARATPEEANIPAPNVRSPETRSVEPVVARSPAPDPAPAPAPAPASAVNIATRAVDQFDAVDLIAEATQWIKRDVAGFREALNFAREAMKNMPKVELGTGAEGSGVGVIVNAGVNVPPESAANGAPPAAGAKAKRGVEVKENEEPKMTLVAITEV
ncbi:uncharacterized protein BDZ99DRAFT_457480 [Mytilinidion resinicola]|uniref:Uncharacterized protein n=1 Tax=Mytilinidion resinicola TaxID=574789 RepID=A0A6A6Z9F4_9PEZI|nr:uncharacterized protein BDZ99DRAFT_457480 [Mytilinidion resinicola]KAF2817762.1 hypothetical protein BDZ99DRAFT_457480 [Mytilinidion resinicola]